MAFTFFFRDTHTLNHAVEHFVPAVSGRSKIRVWDAGCAMGPEPYTLAILLAEKMGKFSFQNLMILASDIDEQDTFGKTIMNGVYPEEELKRIPEDIFAKYFTPAEGKAAFHKIDASLTSRLQFIKHDLLSLKPVGESFSLIVCKNVLLHLQYNERIEVIKMFHKSLADGGLFTTEQTQKMPQECSHLFEQVVPDAQLFRKLAA
ncbi:MAG: CheR family methyltransferase [Bacteroidota bacterium]|nr:CheR family methyltransferase [Bacteroidota bacterium]